ncbi:MAG: hypothetical protein KKD44_25270 [Proteobacteria bacterium]|nr:hypothetical protein [Pseudomonadota bacterium]
MSKYQIIDFLKSSDIYILEIIRTRELYPFTMACAKRFFDNFLHETFEFNGVVRSLHVWDAKENLPRHSYAFVWLYAQSLDELEGKPFPDPLGELRFEYGGNMKSPSMSIRKL